MDAVRRLSEHSFTQRLQLIAALGAAAAFDWVDWFNHRRLLEPIGYVPPAEYEARYYEQAAVA